MDWVSLHGMGPRLYKNLYLQSTVHFGTWKRRLWGLGLHISNWYLLEERLEIVLALPIQHEI